MSPDDIVQRAHRTNYGWAVRLPASTTARATPTVTPKRYPLLSSLRDQHSAEEPSPQLASSTWRSAARASHHMLWCCASGWSFSVYCQRSARGSLINSDRRYSAASVTGAAESAKAGVPQMWGTTGRRHTLTSERLLN